MIPLCCGIKGLGDNLQSTVVQKALFNMETMAVFSVLGWGMFQKHCCVWLFKLLCGCERIIYKETSFCLVKALCSSWLCECM